MQNLCNLSFVSVYIYILSHKISENNIKGLYNFHYRLCFYRVCHYRIFGNDHIFLNFLFSKCILNILKPQIKIFQYKFTLLRYLKRINMPNKWNKIGCNKLSFKWLDWVISDKKAKKPKTDNIGYREIMTQLKIIRSKDRKSEWANICSTDFQCQFKNLFMRK